MMNEKPNKEVKPYESEVRAYVAGNLEAALSAQVDGDIPMEKRNLLLLSRILEDNELKNEIIDRIVNYAIHFSMVSYKPNFAPDIQRTIFMRKIYSFLNSYQLSLLAVHFDKQISAEKSEKRSR